jgi:hypothetical protein
MSEEDSKPDPEDSFFDTCDAASSSFSTSYPPWEPSNEEYSAPSFIFGTEFTDTGELAPDEDPTAAEEEDETASPVKPTAGNTSPLVCRDCTLIELRLDRPVTPALSARAAGASADDPVSKARTHLPELKQAIEDGNLTTDLIGPLESLVAALEHLFKRRSLKFLSSKLSIYNLGGKRS